MQIKSEDIKFIGLLVFAYVTAGIILFPQWYASTLQAGGLDALLYAARTTYFLFNLIAFGAIALLWMTYRHFLSPQSSVNAQINRFLESRFYAALLWVLFVLSTSILLLSGISSSKPDFEEVAKTLEKRIDLASKGQNNLVNPPVDFVYLNEKKLSTVIAQTQSDLKLESISVGKKKTGSFGAAGGIADIAKVEGSAARESQLTENYKGRERTLPQKTIDLINLLHKKKSIVEITKIDIQSEDLNVFDKSVILLKDNYNFELDAKKVKIIRKKIIADNIQKNVPETFKVNSWVMINGLFMVKHEENALELNFDYAPSLPGKVSFVSKIEKSQIKKDELQILSEEEAWSFTLFGKLVHEKRGNGNIIYKVFCYALYR